MPPTFLVSLRSSRAFLSGARGEYPNTTVGFVHIEDAIAAHILAMEEKKASGRFICSSSVAHWSQIIEMLRAKYHSYPFENKWVKKCLRILSVSKIYMSFLNSLSFVNKCCFNIVSYEKYEFETSLALYFIPFYKIII